MRADLGDVGGLGALALALFWVGRSIRADARLTRRFAELADKLEGRVARLERLVRRQRARISQLEAVLRQRGIPVPGWPAAVDDEDLDDELAGAERGAVLIPTPRSAP